jgi:apoptosis-inducing factor 2
VIGAAPSTAFLTDSAVELNHDRIRVNGDHSVSGLPGVWALGDAADTGDPMTVVSLERQVSYLVKRLRAKANGSAPIVSPYKGWPRPPIIVPLGAKHGASQLPMELVVGPWITSLLKGRNLLVHKAVKSLGVADKPAGSPRHAF